MQLYNFTRLINKYSSVFTLITNGDRTKNDMGDYVKGEETSETMTGAIISHTESKILRSEGNLTTNDKKLYTLKPIKKALKTSKVIYDNKVYSIEQSTDNSQITGFYSYNLKYVSAFNKGAVTND